MGAPRNRREAFFLLLVSGLTLFVLVITYFKVPIGVSGEWTWGYAEERSWGRLMGPGFFLVLYLMVFFLGLGRFSRMARAQRALILFLLFVLIFCLQIIAPYLWEYGAVETVITMFSPHATGAYYMESRAVSSVGVYLKNFAQRVVEHWFAAAPKVNVHPPGSTLLIYSSIKIFQAHPRASAFLNRFLFSLYPHYEVLYQGGLFRFGETTFVGLLLAAFIFCFFGSITLIPAYFLTKEIAGKEAAFLAAGFVGLMPSLLIFSPSPDQILPALALFYSFFLVKAIRSRRLFYASLAGLTLFFWSFFHLSFLVMMVFTVFVLLIYYFALPGRRKRLKENYGPTLKIAAAVLVGFLVPNLFLLLLRYNAFQVFLVCLAQNRKFYTYFPRTYWKWALLAIPDFFLFMGIPAACIFLWGFARAWRSLIREKRLEIICLAPLALVAILLVLSIWGVNRGETARLWNFLGPVGLAFGLAGVKRGRLLSRKALLIALILLAVQLILFRLFFDIWLTQRIILGGDLG